MSQHQTTTQMEAETELHWRKEEAALSQMTPDQRTQYIQSTRDAHIQQSQLIIKSIVGLHLIFLATLAHDIISTHGFMYKQYGIIVAGYFILMPILMFIYSKPIFQTPHTALSSQLLDPFLTQFCILFGFTIILTQYVVLSYFVSITTLSSHPNPITNQVLTRYEILTDLRLNIVPLGVVLLLFSQWRVYLVGAELKEIVTNQYVPYDIKGVFTNPEY